MALFQKKPALPPIPYTLIRSSRRTVGLEITPALQILVRAPWGFTKAQADAFVEEHRAWIQQHLPKAAARAEQREETRRTGAADPLTPADLAALKKAARPWFEDRVRRTAARMGVGYGAIAIRAQKTRWGSCSSDGNLNFNCLLMLCPNEVRQYVVVHELCHILHRDHSPAFWGEVARYDPDYRQSKQYLKEQGPLLMARMEGGKADG